VDWRSNRRDVETATNSLNQGHNSQKMVHKLRCFIEENKPSLKRYVCPSMLMVF